MYEVLLKILWLAHRDPLNPKAGGAERTINEVCSRLAEYGHSVTVLSAGWKGCRKTDILGGFRIVRIGNSLSLHFFVPVFLAKNQFELVVNDLGHAVPWISPVIFGKRNAVFFRHLHARSLPGQVNKVLASLITAIEKCYFLIYKNNTFVTESTTSVQDLMKLGIRNSNIVKISPGVDSHLFKPLTKTEFPSMVYFGGLRRYKRPEECIFIYSELRDRIIGLKLFIIGSGAELENLKQLTVAMKLDRNVVFLNRVSDEELAKVVASSWLNIHSSVTEGWGYSIMEASSAGTPTVAYEVPGVVDSIENGINGIKVKDEDRNALYAAALEILGDPEKWWLSSPPFAKKYAWDHTAEMWENLIESILSKQS